MEPVHTSRYYAHGKNHVDFRNAGETLTRRLQPVAAAMDPEDRTFLDMVLVQGITFEQIARLRGEHPTTVSRRFRRIVGRARAGAFAQAAIISGRFGPLEIAILTEVYIRRRPHTDIAAKLGISRYRISKTLARLSGQTRKPQSHHEGAGHVRIQRES